MRESDASTSKSKRTAKKATRKSAIKDKTLVIVESPAKAKTINKYLGDDYIIEASMGHIIDLPKSRIAVDVEKNFEPEYITVRGRAKILNRLKKLASVSSRVLLAADPDREGEAISWHLKRAFEKFIPDTEVKRIEFNEITKSAVKEAVENPRDIDMNLVNAQQARRILDRLVGYNISPLLWKKIKRGLSAGRVQSVALRLICEREEEIDQFVPQEYWSLVAKFNYHGKTLDATLHTINGQKAEIKNEEQMNQILKEIEPLEFSVKSVTTRERKRQPSAPYTTSKLQQDAANKLGFTSQKTMMVAQQLYEGIELSDTVTGLITYMRTDSTRISPSALEQLRNFISKSSDLGKEYLSSEPRIYKTSKSAQDAHEAIRPTDPSRTPESVQSFLSREQFRLYQLVWQKFVSSQMADEISDHTAVDIQGGSYGFRASGRKIKFAGFTKVFGSDDNSSNDNEKSEGSDSSSSKKSKEHKLPDIKEGEKVKLKSGKPEQHFTQPPARFTDASMVKILEESGVGRPSTYAPTIATILKRFYVTRLQRALKPTQLGRLVHDVMKSQFSAQIDIKFTASMEENLDLIAADRLNWVDMLREFYFPFIETVKVASEQMAEMRNILDEKTDLICEKCSRPMVKRIGRNGYFLACSGFPECRNAKAIPLGKCPVCDEGEVIQRATKKGRPFYGCNRYPECDFSTWDKPVAESVCPECGKILLEKSSRERGRYIACSSCGYETSAGVTA